MKIVTISRELAALGDETAQELSKISDCRLVDKPDLEERIKSYGVAGRKFEKYDERKPSFLASLSQDRDEYLHYLKTAILAEAAEGNCVFMGRGAGAFFQGVPGVLSVFLVAPEHIRYERVKNYFRCDEKRARQIVDQSDRDRAGFHRYFFEIEWKEPSNYHLILNTGTLPPSTAAEIIKFHQDRVLTEETAARNTERLQELILGQHVVHHISYEKGIPIHFLETSVEGKTVTLYGVSNSQALAEAAATAAREAVPDGSINSEIQVVQEYSIIP
ncbi:MAG: cytidylate kinase-like family protein [Spirochaetaceae bacterium]|jgi:cytidylate kinase|nr:cytidylate kinase-like family protein [Spirochaetaceae bacterium]